MNSENVVSLVKKLLSLAESKVNEHEAKVAAMKAQELIAKYNITISDEDEETNDIETVDVEVVPGKKWKINLSVLVANNFRCKCFWVGRKRCCFYGYKNDAEVAKEVFSFLFKQGNKCANNLVYKYKVTKGYTEGVYKSFIYGYLIGLEQSLGENSKALMLIVPNEVTKGYNEMMQNSNPDSKSISGYKGNASVIGDAYNKGIHTGRHIMRKREIADV